MKIEICSFSGYRLYPGHGKKMVKADGKSFIFLNGKCEAAHILKRNPRKVTWTVLYRRKHKKGIVEEVSKKRARRTVKFQRAIVGASLNDILAKRNMKPEVRKAQREQAIRAAKEKQRAQKAQKAQKKAPPAAPAKVAKAKSSQKQKAAKPIHAKAPRVGGKR